MMEYIRVMEYIYMRDGIYTRDGIYMLTEQCDWLVFSLLRFIL